MFGGTAEALELARRIPGAVLLLPPGERRPPGVPGSFETADISADWLARTGVFGLIIAPHPFGAESARAAAAAADEQGVPRVFLRRPGWRAPRGARWHRARSAEQLPRLIPAGARIFAATGRDDLAALRRLNARVFLRRISGPPEPIPGVIAVAGTPPFTVREEMRLFRRLGIDWLVLRDAGGPGARPKLDAAHRLGLRVALIDRPAWPDGPCVTTAEEALQWLSRTIPSAASS
ncbi:precorrin-6x reductase [Roseivivax halodurans JCM 10272]|uniref:Precorrin-6x reductase n=1 Tax=Roseivivax halodurans JCM 10272 TaxID=1449350 RepID=X7EN03_9RHOB|nr:precorrin-6x reductase [Roseivivax halodurans JCM 10272]